MIVERTARRTVADARAYCAKEFADFRRDKPTPYMRALRIGPTHHAADPDERMLSDDGLRRAAREGRKS